jgi:hypothetical protein
VRNEDYFVVPTNLDEIRLYFGDNILGMCEEFKQAYLKLEETPPVRSVQIIFTVLFKIQLSLLISDS